MLITNTNRLILRTFQPEDFAPFAKMNADPEVMQHFPSTLNADETAALIKKIQTHQSEHGFSLYACELKETGAFIGFVGLLKPSFDAHFTPCVEIGWRLAKEHWGRGLATEAAKTVLQYGFQEKQLKEIVSFTAKQNIASIRVMEKIGLQYNPEDDFKHPSLPQDHPLSEHVLYRTKLSTFAPSA